MEPEPILRQRVITILQTSRKLLWEKTFVDLHRQRSQDFTRECKLTFVIVMLLIFQKTLKSLQVHLHEFMASWAQGGHEKLSVSAGAMTHARAKLLPSAFIELNRKAVLSTVYGPQYQTALKSWRGHRLLGIDSSLVRLPSSAELLGEFGETAIVNQHGKHDRYPQGRISVLYDLLNHIGLEGYLVESTQGETQLAQKHWAAVQATDVVITDRGFAGYAWFANSSQHCHFICRCSRGSFPVVQELMTRDEAGISRTVTLHAPSDQRVELKQLGLPLDLKVRFVTVRLSTGELEVLGTSLLDEQAYPSESFEQVYWSRWAIETFYGRLKGRLDLENFSGQTVIAVQQDFQATLFLSNLESLVSAPSQAHLAEPSTSQRKHPLQVNRAVSLHTIKYHLIELLASERPLEEVLTQLEQWLVHNPVTVRKDRKVVRRKVSAFRSYNFQRRVRKIVF